MEPTTAVEGSPSGGNKSERVKPVLRLQRLGLGPLGRAVDQPDAADAPALLAGKREHLIDVDRLMRAVEVADAEMDDAGRDGAAVIGRARDALGQAVETGRAQCVHGGASRCCDGARLRRASRSAP